MATAFGEAQTSNEISAPNNDALCDNQKENIIVISDTDDWSTLARNVVTAGSKITRLSRDVIVNPADADNKLIIPYYRCGFSDGPGRAFLYVELLYIHFSKSGIRMCDIVRSGFDSYVRIGKLYYWRWDEKEDFFTKLKEHLQSTPGLYDDRYTCEHCYSKEFVQKLREGKKMVRFYGESRFPVVLYWNELTRLVNLCGCEQFSFFPTAKGVQLYREPHSKISIPPSRESAPSIDITFP